ncbi:MAG TPA: hypothetical protein VHX60_05200 [Acidobacteriaceae bacterium]|jgi:hypothetical protein|nr:hypothetical protein [Acidobacteriaceae bacterium]
MVTLIAIFAVLVLVGLFLLLRSAGRLGQQPSQQERLRHNGGDVHSQGPRASGLN